MLNSIALDKFPELASSLRQKMEIDAAFLQHAENGEDDINLVNFDDLPLHDCVVHEQLLAGSFNMLWIIEFADGWKWIIKIAAVANIEKFDQLAAESLKVEVYTMRLLKTNTTIPVPEVYAYDISFDNIINCPFIIMEDLCCSVRVAYWQEEQAPAELWTRPSICCLRNRSGSAMEKLTRRGMYHVLTAIIITIG